MAAEGREILAYGILRGWDEGFEIPCLGIALHPKVRGSGLSKVFMLFLHAAGRRRGAKQVRLKVYKDNIAARKLCEGLGYRFEWEIEDQLVGFLEL